MTIQQLKKSTQHHISRAETKEAMDLIQKWAHENNHERLKGDISFIKRDFTDLNREKNMGLISNSEANLRLNKLIHGILALIDDLDELENPASIQPVPPTGKTSILMMTANPNAHTKLNLDKEHSSIVQKLEEKQEKFVMKVRRSVNKIEFKEYPETIKPDVLHFSGHGMGGNAGGLIVHNYDKNGEAIIPIPAKGLDTTFKHFKKKGLNIQVVVLNACFSEEQAIAIASNVPYVIGTTISIGDILAIAFSVGFYFELAESGLSAIEVAFSSGVAQAAMEGADESDFVIYKNGLKLNM